MSIYENARIYWEMFDGVEPEEQSNLYVRWIDLVMDVGGWAADDYAYFQVSVYGRETIDSPNLVTLYQEPLYRPTGSIKWKRVRVSKANSNSAVRCIVIKVELIEDTWVAPDGTEQVFTYSDQYADADAPPWGIRLKEASVYCSPLSHNVRVQSVLEDILEERGFSVYFEPQCPDWTPDQLAFTEIPNDRRAALDEVNGMAGWNYSCYAADGDVVWFAMPKSGTPYEIAADNPRTRWSIEKSLDETYNAVRVIYGNRFGKKREIIEHGSTRSLSGEVRADTLTAPESIKSAKAARRFGRRYLNAHNPLQVSGSLTLKGDDGVIDALMVRPGDTIKMTGPAKPIRGTHEISHVTLRPLEWTADVQFGTNSKRFDRWLARLAAGAKSIKRR